MVSGVKRGIAWILLPVMAVVGFSIGRVTREKPLPTVVVQTPSLPKQAIEQEPEIEKLPLLPEIMLTVTGAVRNPGAYKLPADARVYDAIIAAGGLRLNSVLDNINIAAPLIDGGVLTIPEFDESLGHGVPLAARANPPQYTRTGWRSESTSSAIHEQSGLINLNTATQAELETLPGIGPVTAKSIITYRETNPFKTINDLTQVKGIGEKTLENLRSFITV